MLPPAVLVKSLDHVVVRDHLTVRRDDHPGTFILVAARLDVDGDDGRDHVLDQLRDGHVAAEDRRSGG